MEVGSPGSHSASGGGGGGGRGEEWSSAAVYGQRTQLSCLVFSRIRHPRTSSSRQELHGKGSRRVGSTRRVVRGMRPCRVYAATHIVGLQPAHASRCPRAYPRWKDEAEVHMENPCACSSFSFMANLSRTSPGSLSMRKQRVGRRLAANFGFALAADLRIVPVHRLLLSGWWLQHAAFLKIRQQQQQRRRRRRRERHLQAASSEGVHLRALPRCSKRRSCCIVGFGAQRRNKVRA